MAPPAVAEDLLAGWLRLVGPGAAARDAGADLLRRWSQPHRAYHDLVHLRAVLEAVDALGATAADPDAVRLAAWFHDAVHDGVAGEDERASAALATRLLPGLGLPADRVTEVARLVLLTERHDPSPGDTDGAVLCDADLAVLGGTPAAYAAYTEAVRREYAHVPDEAFRTGRLAVLERLLAADPLFRTAEGRRRWASAARRNLSSEADRLRGSACADAAPPR